MNTGLVITIVVMLLMIVGFMSGKFKLGLVALTATTVLCLTKVLTFQEAYAYFSNGNVIMVGSMFVLAGALGKTSIVPKMRNFLLKHPGKGGMIAFTYILGCFLLGQLVVPTALIAMMLPFVAALDGDSSVKASNLLYPGAVTAHAACGALPVGLSLAYFAQLNAMLEANGSALRLEMLDYAKCAIIPGVLCLLYMGFIGWKMFPKTDVDLSHLKAKDDTPQISSWHEKLVYIVFTFTFIGMIFYKNLGMDMYIFPLVADIILVFAKVMDMNDVKNFMNIDVLFMLVGVLPLGTAMQKTGAGTAVADFIVNMLGGSPTPIVLLIAFYFVGALMTQVMSNTATQSIFVPLAIVTAVSQGIDPRAFCLALNIGTIAAMLTPVGSPSIAIAFGSGNYKIKDVLKVCLPLWIVYGCVVIFMANLLYPI